MATGLTSIVIPTLNEERTLPTLLSALQRQGGEKEIIVVDGGSSDRTVQLARDNGTAIVLTSPAGRGIQICHGVEVARGSTLRFLHSDTLFPDRGLAKMEEALAANPDVIGGNFRLIFAGDAAFSRWLTGFYARIRRFGLYYGDSGIFVRRSAYDSIGGMRPIALMEDLDFVRRMDRFGRTCCLAEPPLITSSRRFESRHPLRIIYGWIKLHLLFWLGAAPERLAQIYATHVPPSKITQQDPRAGNWRQPMF